MWPLALTSMFGVSGGAMFAYSSGVFMEPMITELGWSRTQFSTAFVLQMLIGLVILPAVGRLTDRIGPRRVALIGIAPFTLLFAALGLVERPILSWWLLCLLLAGGQAFIAQTVWVSAVIGRFKVSRGLALSVALAGLGLGSLATPILASFYLRELGWRLAFGTLSISWAIIAYPLTLRFFHGPVREAVRLKSTTSVSNALRSSVFVSLMIAGGLFASAYFGLTVHLVPILRGKGINLTAAAALAGSVGLFSILGRIVTGYLLDRLPTRPVAVGAFLLPAFACPLLASANASIPSTLAAVAMLGIGSGAEMDVITFVAARKFGQQIFASVYSIFTALIAVSASSGPLIAGAVFDRDHSYSDYLLIVPVMVTVGAAILFFILNPQSQRYTAL